MSEPARLYPVRRRHVDELADEVGIMQHATGLQPDPDHGYCTDDVARLLALDLLHARAVGWGFVAESVRRNLRFLQAAFEPASGWFRNFRAADGAWLDGPHSEDAHARAMQALGETAADAGDPAVRAAAQALFRQGLQRATQLRAIRPVSAVLLGCDAALRAGVPGVSLAYRDLAETLSKVFDASEMSAAWPWPDPVLTYENGLVARALVTAGRRLADPQLAALGRQVLDWLVAVQTARDGHLSPVGNAGWWPRHGDRARFDQQPIEAASLLMAAEAAWDATGSPGDLVAAEAAYGWFLGRNDLEVMVADPDRGGCFDGLTKTGVNANQGAESTLMWLMALEHMRGLRARVATGRVQALAPVSGRVPGTDNGATATASDEG